MDFEADEVADDEEGRVFERFVVLVELLISFLEVATFGLVLPGEEAPFPNVGETFIASAGLGDALLVSVVGADFVGLSRVRDFESFAEVAEVIRCGGPLGERASVPLSDKNSGDRWASCLGYCYRPGRVRGAFWLGWASCFDWNIYTFD